MHVLVIPSWYQTRFNMLSGVFFKDQALAISGQVKRVGIIAPVLISIKDVLKTKIFSFREEHIETDNIKEYIQPILAFPFFKTFNTALQFRIGKKMLKRYIHEFGVPDVIHLQTSLAGELALWMNKQYKVPFIVTEHWSGFLQNKASHAELKLARRVFSRSKHNIAVSEYFAQQLRNIFQEKFQVVPNSVELDFFAIGTDKFSQFTFLQVGRLDKNKNQEMLIKAFSHFDPAYNMRLKIVGEVKGHIKNELTKLIKSLGLIEKVEFCGPLNREEVRGVMQKSHCLVVSSQVETFCIVAIEAMSCGIPVVSTKCGGPEGIISSQTGILCKVNNEQSLFESMKEMSQKTWSPETIRSYVESNYSSASYANKMLNLMR
tara:strand:+ start:7790 stop:8914 length:1125 start_codon:yes stop_codon:yes gene_type:complete